MCGGDNTHCKVVKGTFTRSPRKQGEKPTFCLGWNSICGDPNAPTFGTLYRPMAIWDSWLGGSRRKRACWGILSLSSHGF